MLYQVWSSMSAVTAHLTERVSSTSSQPLGSMLKMRWEGRRSLRRPTSSSVNVQGDSAEGEGSSGGGGGSVDRYLDTERMDFHQLKCFSFENILATLAICYSGILKQKLLKRCKRIATSNIKHKLFALSLAQTLQ